MLLKEPRGKEVGDSDSFRFNSAYTSRLYRVKINAIQLKESAEENKKTNDQVGRAWGRLEAQTGRVAPFLRLPRDAVQGSLHWSLGTPSQKAAGGACARL